MTNHGLVKPSATLGIIASSVLCFLTIVVAASYSDSTMFDYFAIQFMLLTIPSIIMFCLCKRSVRKNKYNLGSKIFTIVGCVLLSLITIYISYSTFAFFVFEEDTFLVTLSLNTIPLAILAVILSVIGLAKSK